MLEVERIAGFEEQRVLAALRAEPEAIFSAEHVDVRLPLARCDRVSTEPSEAQPLVAGCARHHAALIFGRDGYASGACGVAQHDDLGVLFEEGNIGVELTRRLGGSGNR